MNDTQPNTASGKVLWVRLRRLDGADPTSAVRVRYRPAG
jgi:hypothetical protein